MVTLKNKEIKSILSDKTVKTVKTRTFIAFYRENSLGFPRFAFIVSKKVSKKAVERNRGKRLLKEAVRKVLPALKNCEYDIILIGKKNIFREKMQTVFSDLKYFLNQLRDKDEKCTNIFY